MSRSGSIYEIADRLHDEMVAEILDDPRKLIQTLSVSEELELLRDYDEGQQHVSVESEVPLVRGGHHFGFADVLLKMQSTSLGGMVAILVEVKSHIRSAGAVVRQLKFYRDLLHQNKIGMPVQLCVYADEVFKDHVTIFKNNLVWVSSRSPYVNEWPHTMKENKIRLLKFLDEMCENGIRWAGRNKDLTLASRFAMMRRDALRPMVAALLSSVADSPQGKISLSEMFGK